MSITPTVIIASASPRPYAVQCSTSDVGSLVGASFGAGWVCGDHMSTEHNPTMVTTESKRLDPGSLAGVLT